MSQFALPYNNKIIFSFLVLIVIFSFAVRVYKIDSIPPSLTWDEAAVGYNAWTIANYGRDEYGKFFPLYFRSFGEDKQPIHIYTAAFFVKLLGLTEFSTRLPSALFGSLCVLIIFYLAKNLFQSNLIALLSSLFLAFSPQNIHFSRFNHEANFALFFFMLGLLLFYKSLKIRKDFLPISFICFIISSISYHAAEIIVPAILVLLCFLYSQIFKQNRNNLVIIVILAVGFIILIFLKPQLLGISRFNQTVQGDTDIERTALFKYTDSHFLGRVNLIFTQYLLHFNPKFLFISGDKNSILSSQGAGEFYYLDGFFLIFGLIYLLCKRSKEGFVLLSWALIAPLPSTIVAEAPHAARASFMMGSWHIISAVGLYSVVNLFKRASLKKIVIGFYLIVLFISWSKYMSHYLNEFPKRYAISWQYGMKQIAEYVSDHREFDQVYVTAVRAQPYIFLLYYLKIPLPDYLNTVIYNNSQNQSSNNVSAFGRYSFGGWNPIESIASKGVLYVLSPSEYDGLLGRSNFNVNKIINYPNGTRAFYLVSLK